MSQKSKKQPTEVLDAKTRAALQEGLELAESNSARWTPEQVRADAERMAKERRGKVKVQASA